MTEFLYHPHVIGEIFQILAFVSGKCKGCVYDPERIAMLSYVIGRKKASDLGDYLLSLLEDTNARRSESFGRITYWSRGNELCNKTKWYTHGAMIIIVRENCPDFHAKEIAETVAALDMEAHEIIYQTTDDIFTDIAERTITEWPIRREFIAAFAYCFAPRYDSGIRQAGSFDGYASRGGYDSTTARLGYPSKDMACAVAPFYDGSEESQVDFESMLPFAFLFAAIHGRNEKWTRACQHACSTVCLQNRSYENVTDVSSRKRCQQILEETSVFPGAATHKVQSLNLLMSYRFPAEIRKHQNTRFVQSLLLLLSCVSHETRMLHDEDDRIVERLVGFCAKWLGF